MCVGGDVGGVGGYVSGSERTDALRVVRNLVTDLFQCVVGGGHVEYERVDLTLHCADVRRVGGDKNPTRPALAVS